MKTHIIRDLVVSYIKSMDLEDLEEVNLAVLRRVRELLEKEVEKVPAKEIADSLEPLISRLYGPEVE